MKVKKKESAICEKPQDEWVRAVQPLLIHN